jgi:hypothetical protein
MLYFSLHAINLHSPQPTLIPRFVHLLQVNDITIFRNHFNSYFASSEIPQTPPFILSSRRDDGSTSS